MDYKTGKLHKIIRQFDKGNGTYEINGIDRQKAVFLYRKKAEAFIPIPKGNYRINNISDSMQELEVDSVINDVAVEFQIIYQFEVVSSKYEEQFPELDIVVMKLNQIVDDVNNIVDYSNSVGIKLDSKFQTQILTPLEPLSVWYMNEEGLIDTMPIDSFNKKFAEIMAKMEELANEKANEKVEHHLNRLQQRITKLKTEIEQKGSRELQSLSEKLTQSLETLEQRKNTSISDIEENTSNSLSVITRKSSEAVSDINDLKNQTISNVNNLKNESEKSINRLKDDTLNEMNTAKSNSLEEIEHKKNISKTELESKMPEINRKFNGIAGGLLNFNFIQDSITKMKGQYYLDRNTGKLYQCIQTTTSSVNSAAYFKDVSISGIIDRLENLCKLKGTYASKNNKFKATIFIMSNMVFINVYSHENSMSKLETDEIDLKVILNKELELSYGSLTGNSGTVGTMSVLKNTLKITATSENGLRNSFYGSISTIFK